MTITFVIYLELGAWNLIFIETMSKAIITFFLLVGIMIPSLVFSKVDIQWSVIGKATGFDQVKGYNDVYTLANKIINTVLSLLAIIFLAIMIYGGLRWMTAQGDDALAEKAIVAIKAGIIGFVIAISSYAISYFVFDKLVSGCGQYNETECAKYGCLWNTTESPPICVKKL